MNPSDKHQVIRELLDEIIDGNLTEDIRQKLAAQLTNNPDGLAFYAEYIEMHMALQSRADQNIEFVFRRMNEEFIVRPTDKRPQAEPVLVVADSATDSGKKKSASRKLAIWVVAAVVFVASLIFWSLNQRDSASLAIILSGELLVLDSGHIDNSAIAAGEYQAQKDTILKLYNGSTMHLTADSVIRTFNHKEILLERGAMFVDAQTDTHLLVHTPAFAIQNYGDGFSIDLRESRPIVNSGTQSTLIPKIWRPKHFWSFDGKGSQVIDSAGSAHGIASSSAKRTQGLLGSGAFAFDNTFHARINVGNGGGQMPASGSFAVHQGISVEALISPRYLGILGDEDVIFRKDQTDGELRIHFALQYDEGKTYLKPDGEFGPSLAFGLFILGQGYEELKLPLDGKNGRPTFEAFNQGGTHHVVATYSVQSGLKAIYINGEQLASYQYPPGAQALSGGSGLAHIGHTPNKLSWENQAFNGVIDEVAFYNFALPPEAINQHFNQIQKHFNYFGYAPSPEPLPKRLKISLQKKTSIELEATTGLPVKTLKQ